MPIFRMKLLPANHVEIPEMIPMAMKIRVAAMAPLSKGLIRLSFQSWSRSIKNILRTTITPTPMLGYLIAGRFVRKNNQLTIAEVLGPGVRSWVEIRGCRWQGFHF